MKNIIFVAFFCIMAFLEIVRAESMKINGFEIDMPDGCRVTLSLKGEIINISFDPGFITRDAKGRIQFVGKTSITRDAKGRIQFVGKTSITRDAKGRIQFVGKTSITRDAEGFIQFVGKTSITRNAGGEITSVGDSDQVRPVFAVEQN